MANAIEKLTNCIRARNKTIAILDVSITKCTEDIIQLESKLTDATKLISKLKTLITNGGGCDCSGDWVSIGNDEVTGNKLKRCLICNSIGVR